MLYHVIPNGDFFREAEHIVRNLVRRIMLLTQIVIKSAYIYI